MWIVDCISGGHSIILALLCGRQKRQNQLRMNWLKITTHLGVILVTAGLAIIWAQAEPPPATIDCKFYPVKFPKYGTYSETKVAPNDMVWISSHDPFMPPNTTSPGLVVWDKNYDKWGFVVLGSGRGRLTPTTDLPKLCIQLATVASDHRANAINYQLFHHGTEIRVQFLRIEDGYFRTAGRRQKLPDEVLGNNR